MFNVNICMDVIGMLKSAFDVVSSIFGYARQRDAEKNAPDVKEAAKNKQIAKTDDKINSVIKNEDIDEIRKIGA